MLGSINVPLGILRVCWLQLGRIVLSNHIQLVAHLLVAVILLALVALFVILFLKDQIFQDLSLLLRCLHIQDQLVLLNICQLLGVYVADVVAVFVQDAYHG
jgi:hypothetical protein